MNALTPSSETARKRVKRPRPRGADGLSERIREIANRIGSVSELARRAALPIRTVSSYTSGRSVPSALALVALAHAGNVSIEWLVTGAPERAELDGAETIAPLRITQQPCGCGCGAIVLESAGGGW